jgi:hypothetical protein
MLKTVTFQDGDVELMVPSTWKQEYDNEGTLILYEPRKDSATLRLSTLTGKAPYPIDGNSIQRILTGSDNPDDIVIDKLPNDLFLKKCVRSSVEKGVNILNTFWEIAVPLPPEHWRLVIITYTIRADQVQSPFFIKELDLIDTQIRQASHSRVYREANQPL